MLLFCPHTESRLAGPDTSDVLIDPARIRYYYERIPQSCRSALSLSLSFDPTIDGIII